MKIPRACLLMIAAAVAACNDTSTPAAMSNDQPTESHSAREPVRLSPELRQKLGASFDVGAVERLLQTMEPAEREAFLQTLTAPSTPDLSGEAGGETRDVRILIRSTDPERQRHLDEMWAPYWDRLPPEALDDPAQPYPGREIARARRKKQDDAERSDQ